MKKHRPHIKYLANGAFFSHGWKKALHPPNWVIETFKHAKWVVYDSGHTHDNAIPYLRGRYYEYYLEQNDTPNHARVFRRLLHR